MSALAETVSLKHHQVAERFRYFLKARQLEKKQFLEGIDHAITASSLFSILNGNRKPSRALAVLIEKTWGFRAEFLLQGEGEMWCLPAESRHSELSKEEAAVVQYMRQSVANAHEIALSKQMSELWTHLYRRTQKVLAELEEIAKNANGEHRIKYPLLAQVAFAESQLISDIYGRYKKLFHQKRTHHLTTLFIRRYLLEYPRSLMSYEDWSSLNEIIQPTLDKRKIEEELLETSIQNLKDTLLNVANLQLPSERVGCLALQGNLNAIEDARGELDKLRDTLNKTPADPSACDISKSIELIERQLQTALPNNAPSLIETCRRMLSALSDQPELVPHQSLTELEAYFQQQLGVLMK